MAHLDGADGIMPFASWMVTRRMKSVSWASESLPEDPIGCRLGQRFQDRAAGHVVVLLLFLLKPLCHNPGRLSSAERYIVGYILEHHVAKLLEDGCISRVGRVGRTSSSRSDGVSRQQMMVMACPSDIRHCTRLMFRGILNLYFELICGGQGDVIVGPGAIT